jgi:RNA polymerase sigma-70 factor (ECF subfamily)
LTEWDRILRDHGPTVFGTVWRILGHAADTQDVVQDVFLEAYRLRCAGPVNHWSALLRRLAACRALDRLRQRRRKPHSLNGLVLVSREDGPVEVAVANELAERVRQAIVQLPEREAEVFCLRYLEEMSYEQIAATLNVSGGAVAVALHKARAKLERLLTENHTEEDHEQRPTARRPAPRPE